MYREQICGMGWQVNTHTSYTRKATAYLDLYIYICTKNPRYNKYTPRKQISQHLLGCKILHTCKLLHEYVRRRCKEFSFSHFDFENKNFIEKG